MKSKIRNTIIIFSILMICGILMIFSSLSLSNFIISIYEKVKGIDYDADIVIMKSLQFVSMGIVISLISGFGLILIIVKNIFNGNK